MKRLFIILALLAALPLAAFAEAPVDMTRYNDVKAYIEEQQPLALDLGETKFSIKQLRQLQELMPEGSTFDFTVWFCQSWISSQSDTLDLDNSKKQVTEKELTWLVAHMPNLKKVNTFNHRELSNDIIIPLMEQYPDIEFGWMVRIHSSYVIRSDATAFSTNKHVGSGPYLTEKHMELLKYVPGLRAIDIGHNKVKDISWLRYFPNVNILILADNDIQDITPLADLHELEYLEIFMNDITDVSPLAGLTNLRDLNLCRNKLTDTDLSVLDDLELERFWCTQSGVSKEARERFIAANPETYCNFTVGSCTDDGWRDSYKYDQFRVMFRNRVWAPFVRPEE